MNKDDERRIRDAIQTLRDQGEQQTAANVEAVIDAINADQDQD